MYELQYCSKCANRVRTKRPGLEMLRNTTTFKPNDVRHRCVAYTQFSVKYNLVVVDSAIKLLPKGFWSEDIVPAVFRYSTAVEIFVVNPFIFIVLFLRKFGTVAFLGMVLHVVCVSHGNNNKFGKATTKENFTRQTISYLNLAKYCRYNSHAI